jgi:hypothetical protein
MHCPIDAALEIMSQRLGGPRGNDGRWRLLSASTGESVELYLLLDEAGRVTLHVESRICPLKFAVITSPEQLDRIMGHILPFCR